MFSLSLWFDSQAGSAAPAIDDCPSLLEAGAAGRDAALVIDGKSGQVLYERASAAERHPASLTKMMTLYLLFEALSERHIALDTPLTISRHAAAQHKVNMALGPGAKMSVDTAIKAVVVRSANDVAVAIAEAVGGTEGHFAQLMTAKARDLGMRHTFYHNASGLPDPLQITTAGDLAILARHLAYDFPQYFPYFATRNFVYRGTTYYTHDNILARFRGTDGIKTGYTNASGFNLVSSVVRGDVHVIAVVMGGSTARRRDDQMIAMLSNTFAQIAVNPTLVAHGIVPWQDVEAPGATLLEAGLSMLGPPAPVVSLPTPTLNPLLAASGEIDEDSAEDYSGNEPLPEVDNCLPHIAARHTQHVHAVSFQLKRRSHSNALPTISFKS